MTLSIFNFLRDLLFNEKFDQNGKMFLETKPIVKIIISIILVIVIIVLTVYSAKKEKRLSNGNKLKQLTFVSILAGISFILYFVKFNLPFFMSFLDVQVSNVPALIGGFLFGPISGVIIVIVRTLLKLPMTSTAGVGELADLLIGAVTVLVSSLIYHKNKTKKNAVKALIWGTLAWIVTATLINWLFIADFYIYTMFDGNQAIIYGGINAIVGSEIANEQNYMFYYIFIGILPFNLFLSTLVSFVTFAVYKRVSKFFHAYIVENTTSELVEKNN
ncbi:MAG TPA: ECF transporter S component [Acholeplasmataceae bacterium]|nr:ECF transporter S component [Acholeplasmataceae bacterium]